MARLARRAVKVKEPKIPVVYEVSADVRSVADRLIRLYPVQFGWTTNFRLGYIMVRGLKLNLDKKEPWGKFKKVPPLYRGLTDLDAVIEIVADGWDRLDAHQQEALIAHELCHGSMSERGALRVEKHDLEEFRFVVAQWGAWDEGIKRFGEQLDLFTQRGPALSRSVLVGVQEPITAFQTPEPDAAELEPTSITKPRGPKSTKGQPPAPPVS